MRGAFCDRYVLHAEKAEMVCSCTDGAVVVFGIVGMKFVVGGRGTGVEAATIGLV
jgi:hypothetical protein